LKLKLSLLISQVIINFCFIKFLFSFNCLLFKIEPDSIYPIISDEISKLDIAILFNNVGMGLDIGLYHKVIQTTTTTKPLNNIINCNIMSVLKMTQIVLPGMLERKGGIIVNNASVAAKLPLPFITTYSGTKAFVDYFSR
jgi:17beta-estradiol 17-dehydrogenase / very-long-chain 3-oxoacyl-CoA reductase